jgi:hypothetical protein
MKKEYQIRFIKWWQCKTYKDGISFTGWINNSTTTSVSAYAIVIFDEKYSTCPEKQPCIFIDKEVLGSTIATMKQKERNSYLKKIEKSLIEEAKRYKLGLEQTGFWVRKYTVNGFSKSPLV